jgi:hypothetical protein
MVCLRLTFLPVSKIRTNKLYIFQQYTYIVHMSLFLLLIEYVCPLKGP